MFSVLDKSLGP